MWTTKQHLWFHLLYVTSNFSSKKTLIKFTTSFIGRNRPVVSKVCILMILMCISDSITSCCSLLSCEWFKVQKPFLTFLYCFCFYFPLCQNDCRYNPKCPLMNVITKYICSDGFELDSPVDQTSFGYDQQKFHMKMTQKLLSFNSFIVESILFSVRQRLKCQVKWLQSFMEIYQARQEIKKIIQSHSKENSSSSLNPDSCWEIDALQLIAYIEATQVCKGGNPEKVIPIHSTEDIYS